MHLGGALLTLSVLAGALPRGGSGQDTHHVRRRRAATSNEQEKGAEFWRRQAQDTLRAHLSVAPNTNIARNIVLFLGDGMSVPSLAAARIYQGQLRGEGGEEGALSFEAFPYTGLAKTYCVDSQVADSACSATAYLGGVKANEGTIGVTAAVRRTDCPAMANVSNHVLSIAKWAQDAGMATGLVTTTRVTHASPAALYAHTADRGWEDDAAVHQAGRSSKECPDIAQQLVLSDPGRNFNVVMGGGRRQFYPEGERDPEGTKGKRRDGINLVNLWLEDKVQRRAAFAYVTNRDQLLQTNGAPDYLLGLFAPGHLEYHLDAAPKEPSLEEMTVAAIKVLGKSPNGFFLFVEGGRIDHGHHDNLAKKALDEVVEFSKAVTAATALTDSSRTLTVVTSDHAHVMSFNGYARRGADIFGFAGTGADGLPYSTLSYANGPGFAKPDVAGRRNDLRKINRESKAYKFPAAVPLTAETHGGEDVAVFATGPWAHLLTGSFEQNFIPHALAYASCIGQSLTACRANGLLRVQDYRYLLSPYSL